MTSTDEEQVSRRAMLEELLGGPNFAALTTLDATGAPRTNVMWIDGTPDHLRINTELGRAKDRNMRSDPRVTVMIWDATTPNRFVEVVGTVTGTTCGQEARDHIDRLSQKYSGVSYDPAWIVTERVIFEIEPQRVFACDVTLAEKRPGIWSD